MSAPLGGNRQLLIQFTQYRRLSQSLFAAKAEALDKVLTAAHELRHLWGDLNEFHENLTIPVLQLNDGILEEYMGSIVLYLTSLGVGGF